LGNGPGGVFGDEGIFFGGGFLQGGEVFGGAGVAEGDADVAEEAVAFDTLDGRFCEEGAEGVGVEGEEGAEGVLKDFGTGVESGFAGDLSEAIPRAGVEAVVTAVDAVAEGGAEVLGDGAFVLDGEVGNAAFGLHFLRAGDGVGGAGLDASGAFSAVIGRGGVRGEIEGGEEFAEEEPGAKAFVNLNGGFAVPAETGGGGEVAF